MIFMKGSHCPSIEGAIPRAGSQFMVIGRLQNGPCIKTVQEACAMTDEMAAALPYLDIGDSICVIGGSPVKRPFLIRSADLARPRLTHEEICRHNEALWLGLNLPAIVMEEESRVQDTTATSAQPTSKSLDESLTDALLRDMHCNMFRGVAKRSKCFRHHGKRLTTEEMDAQVKKMEKDGLCICIRLRVVRKGGMTHFYVPSEEGYEHLDYPADMLVATGGSGIEEAFLLRLIPRHLKSTLGVTVATHLRRNGRTPDLVFEHEGLSCAVDLSIQTTTEHEARGARQNIAVGFDRSVTVFLSKRKLEKAEKAFISELGPKVDARIKIAELWQVLCCEDMRDIYDGPGLKVELGMSGKKEK